MNAAIRKTQSAYAPATGDFCDVSILLPADFVLAGGERLTRPELSVRVYGDLSSPVVAVAGGVSAGRVVADVDGEKGWWREIISYGGAIDLGKFCVIAFDFLPNDAELARRISTHDQARALRAALGSLKIETLFAFAGASYGGMTALAFAEMYPGSVRNLCVISAPEKAHPAATALRGVQRRIIQFARAHNDPEEGVSLARQLAMTTYRTPEEFGERFASPSNCHDGDRYDICNYLISRGRAYGQSAERYLTLSDSVDRHHADPSKVKADSLFIASTSDRLVPLDDMRSLASAVDTSTLVEIDSLYGHDAFLKEAAVIGPVIKKFLEERLS